jgi:hypothetical protein
MESIKTTTAAKTNGVEPWQSLQAEKQTLDEEFAKTARDVPGLTNKFTSLIEQYGKVIGNLKKEFDERKNCLEGDANNKLFLESIQDDFTSAGKQKSKTKLFNGLNKLLSELKENCAKIKEGKEISAKWSTLSKKFTQIKKSPKLASQAKEELLQVVRFNQERVAILEQKQKELGQEQQELQVKLTALKAPIEQPKPKLEEPKKEVPQPASGKKKYIMFAMGTLVLAGLTYALSRIPKVHEFFVNAKNAVLSKVSISTR